MGSYNDARAMSLSKSPDRRSANAAAAALHGSHSPRSEGAKLHRPFTTPVEEPRARAEQIPGREGFREECVTARVEGGPLILGQDTCRQGQDRRPIRSFAAQLGGERETEAIREMHIEQQDADLGGVQYHP